MTTATPPITVTLTRRQHEIMLLKLRGRSDTEIARDLCVSEHTVGATVMAAYDRLNLAGWNPDCGPRQRLQQLTVAIFAGQVRLLPI